MALRGRWTECAGRIIDSDRRPKFQDFFTFVNERAKLVDNEFGRDMISGSLKEPPPRRDKMNRSGSVSFVTGTEPPRLDQKGNVRRSRFMEAQAACKVCSKQHNIWKCSRFKSFTHEEKMRVVQSGGLVSGKGTYC